MYAQQVICAHMLLMWQPTRWGDSRLVFLHRKSSEMLEQYLSRELWQFGFEIFLGFEIFTQTVCFLTLAGCETWWFVQFLRAGKLLFIRDLFVSALAWFLAVVFFSQDSLDSGAALEESSGMELDADAVRDAENNINTARWALNQEHYGIVMALRCQEQFGPTQGFILWKHMILFKLFKYKNKRLKERSFFLQRKDIWPFCHCVWSCVLQNVEAGWFLWHSFSYSIIWFIDWQLFSLN